MATHEQRVREMMNGFGQFGPDKPTVPDEKTRRLRCKLILEEALEFIKAAGFDVVIANPCRSATLPVTDYSHEPSDQIGSYTFQSTGSAPDLVEMADGIADISVVTVGTAIACGIAIEPLLQLVDENNLLKIATGRKCPETGKFLKAPNHPKPDIAGEIARQLSAI